MVCANEATHGESVVYASEMIQVGTVYAGKTNQVISAQPPGG